jgi:D-lactate dehydrogenase (cytochrome)
VDRVLQFAGDASCSVFAEIGYRDDDELSHIADRLADLVAAAGGDPDQSLAGAGEGELKDIRAFRHAVPERINAIIAQRRERHPGLHKIATDMAVPDASLGWVFSRYQEILGQAGLDFAAFGHVGNNHFHVNILPRDEAELATAKACYAVLAEEIVARGGCVSAEHGVGRIKKGFLPIQYSPEIMAAFRAVKRWVDPEWRLNRGILIDP